MIFYRNRFLIIYKKSSSFYLIHLNYGYLNSYENLNLINDNKLRTFHCVCDSFHQNHYLQQIITNLNSFEKSNYINI